MTRRKGEPPNRCPCGQPAYAKFCSREHAGVYTRGKRPPSAHCRRCSRPMSGDNLYVSKGRSRCKHCQNAYDRGENLVTVRESKVCECGCGETFKRPPNLTDGQWAGRRFLNLEHRRRGGYKATPDPALANGKPGAARAGKRRAPSVVSSKTRRKAETPPAPVVESAPRFRLGAVPEVAERPARQVPRPSFGLTRRSA